jgi:hypothetical protein
MGIKPTRDEPPLSSSNLAVDLRTTLVAVQPLLDLCLFKTTTNRSLGEYSVIGDILVQLKVSIEQLLHDSRLCLFSLSLCQLHHSMRIPGVSSLASISKVDAQFVTDLRETALHHLYSLLAELLDVDGLLVSALLWGIRVQVEWEPGCGECVVWIRLLVFVDGDLKAVLSYVTPRTDGVADDGDVVVCHVAEGGAESQDGRWIDCRWGISRWTSSIRIVERGKCFVLRCCRIGWMALLNNCHSVSAEWDRKEVAGQLEARGTRYSTNR